jgi:hypothetical protein
MVLILGPIPARVQAIVRRLVALRSHEPDQDERLNGLLLTGGPAGCSYLDENGEVWNWCFWDNSVERVKDGPVKVGLVAIAVERVPELTEWQPRRSVAALDCQVCAGSGSLAPPWNRVQCPECFGLGWLPAEDQRK